MPPRAQRGRNEQGSAVVEFTFLSLLLMVPLVYFIITVGQIQGGSFAVVGAADQAAKVFVAQPDAASGRAAAEQAVLLALADYGHRAANARMDTSCQPADCTGRRFGRHRHRPAHRARCLLFRSATPFPSTQASSTPPPPSWSGASGDGRASPHTEPDGEDGPDDGAHHRLSSCSPCWSPPWSWRHPASTSNTRSCSPLADGASVAAADSFTLGQVESAGGSPTAVLDGARVRSAAADYLDRNGAFARFSGLAVAPATGSPDGSTAVVVLSAAVHPPVVNFLVPDGIRIEAIPRRVPGLCR